MSSIIFTSVVDINAISGLNDVNRLFVVFPFSSSRSAYISRLDGITDLSQQTIICSISLCLAVYLWSATGAAQLANTCLLVCGIPFLHKVQF